jgi:chitinase
VFNSHSTENVAVYFGQTAATSGTSLAKQCADPNIDIVILAFVVSRNYSGGPYPGVNFGAACGGQTSLMKEEAPGLLSCPDLAADIDTCQTTYGKKVLLSIGGGGQSIIFNTASDASAFGGVIWDLFGPMGNIDADLRPFGDVSIDGFDIGRLLASLF